MADTDRTRVADWLHDDYVELQADPTFVAEQLILDITVKIATVMEEKGVTQKELANQLDISPSALSQLLSGDQNISIKRLVKVALALGMQWEVPNLVPSESADVERVETKTRITVAELEMDRPAKDFPSKGTAWGLSVGGEPVDENENDEEQYIAA